MSSDDSAAQLLSALQGVLTEVAKPSQVLKVILGQAVATTGADRGVFVEVTQSGDLNYRVLYRFDRKELSGESWDYSRGILAWVLDKGEGLLINNALEDPRFQNQESVQGLKLISTLCMPIRVKDRIAALVHLEANSPGHFKEEHKGVLETLLEVASPALATVQAGEHVKQERDAARNAERAARAELEESRQVLARDWSFGRFVGRSAPVRALETTIRKAAQTNAPVLLLGETGTGKSIVARVLHHSSPRAKQAFVTVFCPSLEKSMVETELFGHRRGAFTGAVADRIGKVQAANKGTLFLDEIGELPLEIQPKLLRLLQEGTYERVGDPSERTSNVRVIAATNRDLEEEVQAGRFRRDLFERLNFVPIRIPPLRERRDDIPLLLRHCLDKNDAGRWVELEEGTPELLAEFDFAWPGNVRTIEQLAVRLAMEAGEGPIGVEDVKRLLGPGVSDAPQIAVTESGSEIELEAGLPALLAQEEKKWIEEAMRRYPKLTRAELSDKLKISESALYKKLRLYDIQ